MEAVISRGSRFGIIGDRRRQFNDGRNAETREEKKKKKQIFKVGGEVEFELDVMYAPITVLGHGSYGVVCSCVNIETGEMVAIKKIGDVFSHATTALRTLREMQILRRIRPHENIIALRDIMLSSPPWSSPSPSSFRQVYLVQELMDFDLHQVIKSSSPTTVLNCKWIMFQILRGLQHIHSAGVIHRDLKPENILLKKSMDLKICDFGLARTKQEEDQVMTEYVVTRWYRAPELLTGSDWYGAGVDMWSAGCILAEMLGRKPIFPGRNYLNQIAAILSVLGTQPSSSCFIANRRLLGYVNSLPYSPGVSFERLFPEADPLALDLLKHMLVMDPRSRISAAQALQHPYFHGMCTKQDVDHTTETLSLAVDQYPDAVDETLIRTLIWREMLFYHHR